MNALIRFYREEEGVTAIEYGLIASLIAVAIIVAVTIGRSTNSRPCSTSVATALTPLSESRRQGIQRDPRMNWR